MNKESRFELQKLDFNCNDCGHMARDFDAYSKWEKFHQDLQEKEFIRKKEEAFRVASECEDAKGRETLFAIHNKMTFQFDKSGLLQYGLCGRFQKSVSFIPGICQLETQACFIHRRTMREEKVEI